MNSRTSDFNYGWVVVGAGALMTCVALGTILALPVFLQPISVQTGWTRAGISMAITISMMTMGVASFAWGNLSDRIGPRPVILTGVVLLCAALLLTSQAQSVTQFQLSYGLLVGVASGSFTAPLMSTVILWFERHRALAVSLVSAGFGMGPMTISPLASWLVADYGWRTALMLLAGLIAVLLIPASLLVRRPQLIQEATPGSSPTSGIGAQVKGALRSAPFLILAFTYFACCATHSGPIFHTVSYAIGCGISAMTAVTIYSVEGFAGLVGRLLFGMLADRFGVKRMIIIGLAVQAMAAGTYAVSFQLSELYATAFVFGLAYGGVMPLYAVLVRSYFAPSILGSVMGALTLASGAGMALGPAIGGWIYDHYNSYLWMYLGSMAVGAGAMAIAFALPRPGASRTSLAT